MFLGIFGILLYTFGHGALKITKEKWFQTQTIEKPLLRYFSLKNWKQTDLNLQIFCFRTNDVIYLAGFLHVVPTEHTDFT